MFRSRSRQKEGRAHRYVDMWAFMGVHPCNIDFFKRLKRADDVQFGAHMDVCGTVSERDAVSGRWAETHIVGIRTDVWNPNREQQQHRLQTLQMERQELIRKSIKSSGTLSAAQMKRLNQRLLSDPVMMMRPGDIESRRLVMKLFHSAAQRVRWAGSLEEVTTREVHNSLGSKRVLLSFSANMDGSRYITDLQENHRTFRIPSIYSFCYLQERRQRMWYVNIRRKWISIGADFVVEAEGKKIGDIDGALFGFGYNAHVTIDEPDLSRDNDFVDLITLFATTVGYHKAMRRAIRRRLKAVQRGLPGLQTVEDEEIRLLKSPRAA